MHSRGGLSSPALHLRPVPDSARRDVVEGHLDHQLGAQQDPLELVRRPPSRRLAGAALAGLIGLELVDERSLLGRLEARRVADLARLAGLVVEPEDQRSDGALLLAGPPADHDAIDRADALDLHHPRPLARPVRTRELLGDDAFAAQEPRCGLLGRSRGGCDLDPGELLQSRTPLRERQVEQLLVAVGQQIERDELRRRLLGQHRDPRRRGMDALAEQLELLPAAFAEDDDLAVEHVALVGEGDVGEVAQQRLAVA